MNIRCVYKRIFWSMGILFIISLGLEVALHSVLLQHSYFCRHVPTNNLTNYYSNDSRKYPELAFLCGKDHLETLKNVMNFVRCEHEELPISFDIKNLIDHAERGGSFNCSHMAELYVAALQLQGMQARKIFLVKNFGDAFDSHTTVEIFIDGSWVIFDPTFHVSFKKNDQFLSAQEISESLYDGTFYNIEPIFYGEVAYPCRLSAYYMHWLSLFNNVMYHRDGFYSASFLIRNSLELPFRYQNGPTRYYLVMSNYRNDYLVILNYLYFISCVGLPAIIRSLIIIMCLYSIINALLCLYPYFKKRYKLFRK